MCAQMHSQKSTYVLLGTCTRTFIHTYVNAYAHNCTQPRTHTVIEKNVRICMHIRACTYTHLCMHKPQHANAHSHTCTTRIHRRHTYTCTHNTHANTSCRGGGRKGIRACGIFEKLNDNVCLNGSKALRANPDTNTVVITRVHDQSSLTAAKRIP